MKIKRLFPLFLALAFAAQGFAASDDPTGTYLAFYSKSAGRSTSDFVDVSQDPSGQWQIYNLCGQKTYMPCNVGQTEIDGRMTPALTLSSGTACYTQGDVTYDIYLATEGLDGNPALYGGDIVFIIDRITGNLVFASDEEFGVALASFVSARSTYVGRPDLKRTNTTYTATVLNQNTYDFEEVTGSAYSTIDDTRFDVYGLAGYTLPLSFDINTETALATATNQVAFSDPLYGDFVWRGLNEFGDPNPSGELHAKLNNLTGNRCELEFTDSAWEISSDQNIRMEYGTAAKLTFNFRINGLAGDSGISAVETNDSSSEIKYYNLQGIPVDNPNAGEVYIKRQKGKTEKIIAR